MSSHPGAIPFDSTSRSRDRTGKSDRRKRGTVRPWARSRGPGLLVRAGHGSILLALRRVIARIPRGQVATYGQVAQLAGLPGGARVTVRALQGPDSLPWHRVVAAQGRIALPEEAGREQRLRLSLEGVSFRGGRVRLDRHLWSPRRPSRPRTRRGSGPAKSSRSHERRGGKPRGGAPRR